MSSTVKYRWSIKQYARYVYAEKAKSDLSYEDNLHKIAGDDDEKKHGTWKPTESENGDLKLSYLEIEHLLITKKNIILESFSLVDSNQRIHGVTKGKTLMIMEKMESGCRCFRIEFNENSDASAITNCEDCSAKLKVYFPIKSLNLMNASFEEEEIALEKIDEALLDKVQLRKAYATANISSQLKDLVLLCLIDSSFPNLVADVQGILKELKK